MSPSNREAEPYKPESLPGSPSLQAAHLPTSPFPQDYLERVYAGVLGKMIGVYLGRPFEGWTYERILAELGVIEGYVNERLDRPLVVTDDDITGTFTFLRALPDHACRRTLTPAEIGETWLNYLIEGRTILWWGGLGRSSEHTAYLRLKNGIQAPRSGSAELNGRVVSEQIGAQIFIDGWAMVAPGDPEMAADFARRAASVSHDGEAVYAAQVLAAMEALAFVEPSIDRLLDTAVSLIPQGSLIYRLIGELRDWAAEEPDWRKTREFLAERYGYDRFPGGCHMVPNHGLVILGLLYGHGDFGKSLSIVNTCGWDTDCNSGNLGCLLGIKNGLAGIEAGLDYRSPLADRLYLPTADGGRCISDAVQETYRIAGYRSALAGETPPVAKNGARFHFDLPGAAQGFHACPAEDSASAVTLENVAGHSSCGQRSLAIHFTELAAGQNVRVATATFIPPQDLNMPGYSLVASPTLYPGQRVRTRLSADKANSSPVTCSVFIHVYGADDQLASLRGPQVQLASGEDGELAWRVPDTNGAPIAEVGVEITAEDRGPGTVYLDWLTWDGEPEMILAKPDMGGTVWRRAWVNGVDHWEQRQPQAYLLVQNAGTGLLIQGAREWADYRVTATITPYLLQSGGLAARVQGMRRYYALLLCQGGTVRLEKVFESERRALAEAPFPWEPYQTYQLSLQAEGQRLTAWVDDRLLFETLDPDEDLDGGALALVCSDGCLAADMVSIKPV